ncbi:nitroreductase [Ilumatobacter fluminis]|uniref:Nitroreductase n=2 Tax=Ilumatobacter fluminis TaxID=467091 RepID=A0A4R7I3P3_9ACTN|nr:nitroreductase [Ilumatobacter fluminis]
MSTLRAVRKLKPDPIPSEVLERVLQAACWAPTGGNQQPWKVIVVTDPARKAGLQEIYRPEWQRYVAGFMKRLEGQPDEVVDPWRRVAAAGDHLADHLHEAPAILVFCANPAAMAITDAKLDRVSIVGGGSVYPAVQNAMLACVAEGLGCTLTTLHCLREDEVKALLDIPDSWGTAALVPIGYPVGRGHGPITRKGPGDMAASDTFDQPWH